MGLYTGIIGLSLSLLIGGCASTYKLGQDSLVLQSNMTTESAMSIVEDVSEWTPEQRGLCLSIDGMYDMDPSIAYSLIVEYEYTSTDLSFDGIYKETIQTTLDELPNIIDRMYPKLSPEEKKAMVVTMEADAKASATKANLDLPRDKSFLATMQLVKKYGIDLTSLTSIRIRSDIPQSDMGACFDLSPGKYYISLSASEASNEALKPDLVRFNLREENLNRFLAALTYLSPQAKLITGVGF